MKEIYKGYEINSQINEWGYFEAININDCDAPIIISKTIYGLKTEIDEIDEIEKEIKKDEDYGASFGMGY